MILTCESHNFTSISWSGAPTQPSHHCTKNASIRFPSFNHIFNRFSKNPCHQYTKNASIGFQTMPQNGTAIGFLSGFRIAAIILPRTPESGFQKFSPPRPSVLPPSHLRLLQLLSLLRRPLLFRAPGRFRVSQLVLLTKGGHDMIRYEMRDEI